MNSRNMQPQYTNELTSEILVGLNRNSFTADHLKKMDADALAIIKEQEDYARRHPIIAIFRAATEGSLTRRGGIRTESRGDEIQLENGNWVNIAFGGDEIHYPDGSAVKIITHSGRGISFYGHGFALVSSIAENGDEIISTPQKSLLTVRRKGVPEPADFLKVVK